jgi:hypothetical protein
MIRPKDGKRVPEGKRMAVFEIIMNKIKQDRTQFEDEIDYFDESQGNIWFIKYKKSHLVKEYILDLCVYNDDGIAKLNSEFVPPNAILPSLIKRYQRIKVQLKPDIEYLFTIRNSLREHGCQETDNIISEIAKKNFRDDLFAGAFEQNNNNYKISLIANVSCV